MHVLYFTQNGYRPNTLKNDRRQLDSVRRTENKIEDRPARKSNLFVVCDSGPHRVLTVAILVVLKLESINWGNQVITTATEQRHTEHGWE